jgi:Baseplate J-like protein
MTFLNENPVPLPIIPIFDYTSRDYLSIYTDLLARRTIYMPEWTSQSSDDFGIVLLQLFAYVGDLLGYYVDRLSAEAFLETATQPQSILNIAAMLDYTPTLSNGASVTLQITASQALPSSSYPVIVPAGSQFSTVASLTSPAVVYQTLTTLSIPGLSQATPTYVGSVGALQGLTISNEQVATSDGSINQSYQLQNMPVSAGVFTQSSSVTVLGAPTTAPAQVLVDLGLGPQQWTYVQNLINYGPASQVWTSFVDQNGFFWVVFGDGVNGYVPPLGSPITATYQINVSSTGNVGIGQITQIVQPITGVVAVTNPSAASGGTVAETIAQIQAAVPASLQALNRGVTSTDLATLAEQVPGVYWASAVEVTYQVINLYIAPVGGGSPSTALINSVAGFVDPLTMANTTVNILSPTYINVNITATVSVFSNYGNTAVQQNIVAALEALLAVNNTGFGYRVTLGNIYSTILGVAGVNYCSITALNRAPLAFLTVPLTNGSNYSSFTVSPLPQEIFNADSITLATATGSSTQVWAASANALPGATTVAVTAQNANANYAAGSTIQDTTFVGDVLTLAYEIPIVGTGTLTISVSGGVPGT